MFEVDSIGADQQRLLPLAGLPERLARGVRVVLTDIDDTLTTEGQLTAAAYAALERLRDAGFIVIPITGRPAGWCDLIARLWPVDAVVGENGALYFMYDRKSRTMRQLCWASNDERSANRRKLDEVRRQILEAVPGAGIASDQPYRIADLAIDFCEDVPHLGDAEVDRIVGLFQAAGAQAKVSSIHVNGWFGDYDKLTMTRTLLHREFGIDLDAERDAILYAGDSPNDEPMFRHFPLSVGVANIRDFLHRIDCKPAYVTEARSGAGFVEVANKLLAMRAATPTATHGPTALVR